MEDNEKTFKNQHKGKSRSQGTVALQNDVEKARYHETDEDVIQLIIFALGDEEFAADIEQVREIIRVGQITPIPDSPDFIKGVTNVRGEIAVAIDLKMRFYLRTKEETKEKHMIISERDKSLFGLLVDEVTEVLRINRTDLKHTPELVTRIDRVYIRGVLTLENRLIMLLDLTKVLSEEELEKLAKIQIHHRDELLFSEEENADDKAKPRKEKESEKEKESAAEELPKKKGSAKPTKE